MTCIKCSRRVIARGYCTLHYQRWRKHGDPSVVLPRSYGVTRKYAINEGYFDRIETPEQAYWLGFIAADGGVLNRDGTYRLSVELKKDDADHLQLLADALSSNVPVKFYRGCASVTFHSLRMIESLARFGIVERKSATCKPWAGLPELMPHYWRGLFDGDGTIYISARHNNWVLGICGSHDCVQSFAEWARKMCSSHAKAIPCRPGSSCWKWQVMGKTMPRLLAEALYVNGIALERKRALADILCERG